MVPACCGLFSPAFPWTRVNNCTRNNLHASGRRHRCRRVRADSRVTVDALAQARKRLSSRITDSRLRFFPDLQEDLRAVLAAFDEIEKRTSALASFALRKHFWPQSQVSRLQLSALMEMGTDAETVARIAIHGATCTCEECMGHGG